MLVGPPGTLHRGFISLVKCPIPRAPPLRWTAFSRTMMSFVKSLALMAAMLPAAPAPMIRMSVFTCSMSVVRST